MSTGEVDKFEQTLIINQNYKLFQSGMLLLAQGRNSNFELFNDDDDDHGDDDDNDGGNVDDDGYDDDNDSGDDNDDNDADGGDDDDDNDDANDEVDDDYMGSTMTITYRNILD